MCTSMCRHVVYVHVYVYSLCEEVVGATFFLHYCIVLVIHDRIAADHPMDGLCWLNSGWQLSDKKV